MARKPRPDPYSEGSLALIDKYFFRPLIVYKPEQSTLSEWYEFLFDYKHRDITRYVAQAAFTIPGILYLAPLMKVQGVGYKDVAIGTELYVRKDARHPDIVDVEFQGGPGGAAQVFCLTALEWLRVQPFCREEERERKN